MPGATCGQTDSVGVCFVCAIAASYDQIASESENTMLATLTVFAVAARVSTAFDTSVCPRFELTEYLLLHPQTANESMSFYYCNRRSTAMFTGPIPRGPHFVSGYANSMQDIVRQI